MREQRRFRPDSPEGLEARVALSLGGAIAPVAVGKHSVSTRADQNQAIVAAVNQTFDSFTTDYLQAQGPTWPAVPAREPRRRSSTTWRSGSSSWPRN